MKRPQTLLLAILCATLTLAPAAEAGWMTFASSVLQAKNNGQKHPETLSQMLIVRRDSPNARICATYLNTSDQKAKGRVVTKAGVVREDGSIDTYSFAGPVRGGSYVKCKPAGRLREGDMVLFDFELKGMSRLRRDDIVEINGVVSTAGVPPIERHGLVPPGDGGWVHAANSVFLPDKNRQKHPEALERMVTMPRDADKPQVCTAYSREGGKKKNGRVVTTAKILRQDGAQETVKFVGPVRNRSYLECKPIGNLLEGDAVTFEFELKGMDRLQRESKKNSDLADIYGAVSTAGEPLFQDPPEVDDPPPGGGNPGGGGGGGGGNQPGSLSAADYNMACATLIANRKTQIQRPRADNPARFLVLGPKSTADASGTRADLRNTGAGNTISAAAADYERKTRDSLGNGCTLSSRDRAAIEWYHNMSSSAGPTAIRRDSGGGYHADFWRPWAHVIQGGFGSVAAVVDFLKKQGL